MSRCTVDTVVNGPDDEDFVAFTADGRRTGHGTAWLWAPPYAMPSPPPWQPVEDQPVVALLDADVQAHTWLAEPGGGTPLIVRASDLGWAHEPPQLPAPQAGPMSMGKYFGHGTFVAGLVRRRAPGAQVLSVPVMRDDGQVDDNLLIEALRWLAGEQARHRRRMIVLMAFGRRSEVEDPALGGSALDDLLLTIKEALVSLAGTGAEIVASAGNDASERPRYPAAFAVDADLAGSVVSVGARVSPTERAPFSNYGPWVREWRGGRNIVSLMPLAPGKQRQVDGERFDAGHTDQDNFAWWSGTSFAAAIYACERARRLVGQSRPLAAAVTAS